MSSRMRFNYILRGTEFDSCHAMMSDGQIWIELSVYPTSVNWVMTADRDDIDFNASLRSEWAITRVASQSYPITDQFAVFERIVEDPDSWWLEQRL